MKTPARRWTALALGGLVGSTLLVSTAAGPALAADCTPTLAPVSTNLDHAGWEFAESTGEGTHAWVEGGLKIATQTNDDKSVGRVPVTVTPLSEYASNPVSLDYDVDSGPAPSIQLTFLTKSGNDFVWAGNLVYESVYGGDWWSTRYIPGIDASGSPGNPSRNPIGTLSFIAENADTPLYIGAVGYSLGSSQIGSGIIRSVVADCTKWTFDLATPTPTPTPTPSPTICRVPDVVGTTLGQAKSLLRSAHCTLGTVEGSTRHSRVARQTIPAGTRLVPGDKVGLRMKAKKRKRHH